jgi:membrane-bound serine protease (ClpP class)
VALITAILLAIFLLPSPWGAAAVLAGTIVELGESVFWLRWSRRRRAQVGAETLVGRNATVVTPCRPIGQVRVQGELWRARCDVGANAGDRVRIVGREGLTLVVEPADS